MSQPLSPSTVDFFDDVVTGYLDGRTAVNARPITFAEIEALDSEDGPADLLGYVDVADAQRPGQTLLAPAHFVVARRPGPPGEVYAMKDPDPTTTVRKPDRSKLAGRRVHVEATTAFRRVNDYTFYTTPEAESATDAAGDFRPAAYGRSHVYLADDRADEVPLAPINGAYASVSFAAPGVSPKALADRMRQILAEEFGISDGRVVKVQTSATLDQRVDVTDRDGRVVAVNVLEAEVYNLMVTVPNGPLSTRPTTGGPVVVGG